MATGTMRVAALCAGYGGLELALAETRHDTQLAWCADPDPHAAQVMATHWPHAPNHGDITQLHDPPAADIVCAGFPCQPFSQAGKRAGIHDERWLIDDVARIAADSGAQTVILENVPGILSANGGAAMGRTVAALAQNGFVDGRWLCLRASDIGAPHRRERWFATAHTSSERRQRQGTARANADRTAAHTDSERPQKRRLPETETRRDTPDATRGSGLGPYQPACEHWARIIGRPWPPPLHNQRLNPQFVEWMMGLPEGHVTHTPDLSRSQQLRILGNGVVPQQAAHAIGRTLS